MVFELMNIDYIPDLHENNLNRFIFHFQLEILILAFFNRFLVAILGQMSIYKMKFNPDKTYSVSQEIC